MEYVTAEERIEGKLYSQSVEGFTELSADEVTDFNERLAAHELAQEVE